MRFIQKHYQEALKLVCFLTTELTAIKGVLHLNDNDFLHFHAEEHKYLESLKQLSLDDQLSICFVQVLDELEQAK